MHVRVADKGRAWLPVLSRPRGREAAQMDFEVAPLESGALFCFVQLGWVLRRSVDQESRRLPGVLRFVFVSAQ